MKVNSRFSKEILFLIQYNVFLAECKETLRPFDPHP